MNKKLFTSLFILTINISIYSQSMFQKIYQGNSTTAYGAQQTTDGGYIIAGYAEITATDYDYLVIKTNANGDTLWTRTYGGIGDEEPAAIQQTTDGGYIIVGSDNSSGIGNYNVYVVKINSIGDTLWTKSFGGGNNEFAQAVQQTMDGGYIIAGYTNSFSSSNDVYLLKTDVNGALLWSKTYGGTYDDYAYAVEQTIDNGYIIAGATNSFNSSGLSTNGKYSDVYLLKTDVNGNLTWNKTYGRSGNDWAYGLTTTYDKGYAITGLTCKDSLATEDDIYLLRTDVNGDTLFTESFGGPSYEQGTAIVQTSDSGLAICGSTYSFGNGASDFYLIKTNKKGNVIFNQTYGYSGGNDGPYSISQTMDNGFDISGYTDNAGTGNDNFYLVKTDLNGNSANCHQTNPIPVITEGVAIINTPTVTANVPITSMAGNTNTHLGNSGISLIDASCNTTEIKQVGNNNKYQFVVYPNPGNGNIYIKTNNLNNNTQLIIYNQLGQIVLDQQLTNELTSINLDVNSGVYQIRILNNKEVIYQTKIIKE